MLEKVGLTRMAQSLAAHAGERMGTIARNIANADTPRFKAQDLESFDKVYGGEIMPPMRATRPEHLHFQGDGARPLIAAPDSQAPKGNDVSLDVQMMKTVEARQSHDLALAVYRATSSIISTSLGRK